MSALVIIGRSPPISATSSTKGTFTETRFTESDLATIKEMVATEKQELKTLIDKKDEFYAIVRKNRTNKANSNK